jgi:hypothetical protein
MAAAFHPSSITLGLFNRPDAADAGSSSNNRNGMMYFGLMSAGVSYFIRNRVRAAIANNRAEIS